MLPTALREHPFLVVDLETTGASALYDRAIELAALRIRDGKVEDAFETLLDPGMPIPGFITGLTGIDDRMVRGKPTLEDVVCHIERMLEGATLVAHNASFDYGFLKRGFQRRGTSLTVPRLCTMRLSRRLHPGMRSHRLDALMVHYRIPIRTRHRARPDAEATAQVLSHLMEEAAESGVETPEELQQLQEAPIRQPRAGKVDEAVLASLPSGPGVYLLKNPEGHVLYVGKSQNVRRRVREHLRGECFQQPALRRAIPFVADVEAIETGSELEALVLESRLIRRYLPDANRMQREFRSYSFIKVDLADPFPRLMPAREPQDDGAVYFGPFRRLSTVAGVVDFVNTRLGLRQCAERIRGGSRGCPLAEMGRCLAPCLGRVTQEGYRTAVQKAIDLLSGRCTDLLEALAAERDRLARELRFEEAAELRDRMAELEQVVGAQTRMYAVAEKHLVVIAPSRRPDAREIFFLRAGRLALQMTVSLPADRGQLAAALHQVYSGASRPLPVSREEVDEMAIIDSWLRRCGEAICQVPVQPGSDLGQVLDALLTNL